jgi:hypothetical protein
MRASHHDCSLGTLPATAMYEVLYHFSSPEGHLVEIRRLDQVADTSKDRVYQWPWIDRSTVTSLRYLDMATLPRQERSFAEAKLWFDNARGELRWAHGAVVSLQTCSREALPRHAQLMIHQHLN